MEKFMMAAGTALRVLDTEKGDTTVVLLHGYLRDVWREAWKVFFKRTIVWLQSICPVWEYRKCRARCIPWSLWLRY